MHRASNRHGQTDQDEKFWILEDAGPDIGWKLSPGDKYLRKRSSRWRVLTVSARASKHAECLPTWSEPGQLGFVKSAPLSPCPLVEKLGRSDVAAGEERGKSIEADSCWRRNTVGDWRDAY